MILPTELEPIARIAFARFAEAVGEPAQWEELSATAQAQWRDRVFDADKMRHHGTLENFQDDCALQAIFAYESGRGAPDGEQEDAAALPAEVKPKRTRKKE